MSATQLLPVIRPITDLRTHMNEVCSQATETGDPVVLTKNGKAAYVLMDVDAYEESVQDNRVYLALREAEIEEKYHPESLSQEEADQRTRELLDRMGIDWRAEGLFS